MTISPQVTAPADAGADREKPVLLYFRSERSGRCRRVDAFLAQVLQRRGNHDTFALCDVDVAKQDRLVQRFRVGAVPTLVVVEQRRVSARLVDPGSATEIERF